MIYDLPAVPRAPLYGECLPRFLLPLVAETCFSHLTENELRDVGPENKNTITTAQI